MATLDHPELRESLNILLKNSRPRLERVLRNFEIPPEDAEDILQDAQLTLLYKWDKIRSPESWLIGTVKKKCIMYWRKRRGSLCEAVDTAILDLLAVPQAPDQEKAELTYDLNRVLARLSTRCRSLLKLRYGLGYGPTEVAEQMGYRTSSIRKVTNRCLAALTRQLLAVGFDQEPQGEPQGWISTRHPTLSRGSAAAGCIAGGTGRSSAISSPTATTAVASPRISSPVA